MMGLVFSLPGDPWAVLYDFWWQKYSHLHHLNFYLNPLLNAPYGVNYHQGLGQSLTGILAKGLVLITNEVFTYNFLVLLGFILTFVFGYALGFKLTKNKLSAVLTALIFTFAPYRLAHASQHLILANIHWLVFFILALILYHQKPNWRSGALVLLSLALTVFDGYLYGILAGLILAVWLISKIIWAVIQKQFRPNLKHLAVWLMLSGLILLSSRGIIQKILTDPQAFARQIGAERSYDELKVYSGRHYNYFLPSPANLVFGSLTEKIYSPDTARTGTNLTEQSLYLGWVPILLIIIGFGLLAAKRQKLTPDGYFPVLFLGLVAVFGYWFSFAPQISIFGRQFYTPSHWLFTYLPFVRVYSRFGLLVILAVGALAGIGLDLILKSVNRPRLKYFLLFTFFFLLLIEYADFKPWPMMNVSEKVMPPVYQWLKSQPGEWTIAEYPLLSTEEPKSYDYLLWQRYHQKPLLYGALTGSPDETKRQEVRNIADPQTLDKLKQRKVKFVIIHTERYNPQNAQKYPIEYNWGQVPDLSKIPGLTKAAEFENTLVYQIK